MKILVTGSAGLIGSEAVKYFTERGNQVIGFDNNMRKSFFGDKGDVRWNISRLEKLDNYTHYNIDIRNREDIFAFFKKEALDVVIHCAAQPSHDLAADRVFDDFSVNALGTLNLLEATRQINQEIIFVHMSTNKVYGDLPNDLNLVELEKRWDYKDQDYYNGIKESFSIDQSKHSLFGASKLSADILVQEYGRYFGIRTCCLRGGCLTGPNHSGVELHGFLSYLIKTNLEKNVYKIFGYKGKQVRDNIHSYDVVRLMEEFIKEPRIAEVYNLGGGRENSISILEAFDLIESISGIKMNYEYLDDNRIGDHICYISDLTKLKEHYPSWSITKDINDIFGEIYKSWVIRNNH
jgi:CDP-paratose 2-epimerase